MFTGLIETVGRVAWIRRRGDGATLRIEARFAGELERGESVAVNGVCQTVVALDPVGFEVEAVRETLGVTSLGGLSAGDRVNLERALKVGDRLGGHMVAGHVDGVGRVESFVKRPDGALLKVVLPPELARHVVERGSIAIDGVSLTVARIEGHAVSVAVIPETLEATIAGSYRAGARVNVETDLLAKHQEKLASGRVDRTRPGEGGRDTEGGLTEERLKELGFME